MKIYDCGVAIFFVIFSAVFFANVLSDAVKEPPVQYHTHNKVYVKRQQEVGKPHQVYPHINR